LLSFYLKLLNFCSSFYSLFLSFYVFISRVFGVFSHERLKSSTKVEDETSSMITPILLS